MNEIERCIENRDQSLAEALGVTTAVERFIAAPARGVHDEIELNEDEQNDLGLRTDWGAAGWVGRREHTTYSLYSLDEERGLAVVFESYISRNARGQVKEGYKIYRLIWKDGFGRLLYSRVPNARGLLADIRQGPENLAAGLDGALKSAFDCTSSVARGIRVLEGTFFAPVRVKHGLGKKERGKKLKDLHVPKGWRCVRDAHSDMSLISDPGAYGGARLLDTAATEIIADADDMLFRHALVADPVFGDRITEIWTPTRVMHFGELAYRVHIADTTNVDPVDIHDAFQQKLLDDLRASGSSLQARGLGAASAPTP